MGKARNRIRRWARRLAVGCGVLVLLVAVLFLVAQTPWAKRRIASAVERALGKMTGSEVRIKSLRGTVPFSVVLDDVRFEDTDGVWLQLDDLHVRWAPLALVRGHIVVHEITSSAVTLERVPPMPRRPPQRPRPPWREMIPSIVVGKTEIKQLTLGPALAGERTVLHVAGSVSARRPMERAATTWRIERTDADAYADISATLHDEPAELSLTISVHEPDGRVLGRLAGLPEPGDVNVFLRGAGPLTAWKAELQATASELADIASTFLLDLQPGPVNLQLSNPRMHGTVRLMARHEEHPLNATADFALDAGRLSASRITAQGAGGHVTGHVAVDITTGLLEGELLGDVPRLASLASLGAEDLDGSATFRATLRPSAGVQDVELDARVKDLAGRFGQCSEATIRARLTDLFGKPRGSARVHASDFHVEDLEVATLEVHAEGDRESLKASVRSTGRYREPFDIEARAAGRFDGPVELQQLEGTYATIPVQLQRPAAITWIGPEYALSDMDIMLGDGRVVVSGRMSDDELSALVEVTGLPLRLLGPIGVPETEGLASLRLDLGGPPSAPRIQTELTIEKLKPLAPAYADLAPATLYANARLEDGRFSGKLSLTQGEGNGALETRFRFPLTLSLAPVALNLPPDGQLEATLTADAPIGPLSALILPERYGVRGHLATTLRAGGTFDAPELVGRVSLQQGAYTDTATDTAISDVEAAVEIEMKDGVLSLKNLAARAGRTDLTGRVAVTLGARPWTFDPDAPFDGTITARAELADLAPFLAPLLAPAEYDLKGRIALTLDGSRTPDRSPEFNGSLTVEDIAYRIKDTGSLVDDLDATATIALRDGVLAVPEFTATSAAGTASGTLRIGAGTWPWELAPDRLLEATLLADVRLEEALSTLFTGDQRLKGRFAADLALAGTSAEPAITGWLRIRDGAYENLRTGTVLNDITADIAPSQSRLVLSRLSATDGHKGTISAAGWLDVLPDKQFPFEITLALADMALLTTDYLTGAAGGDVVLSGSATDMLLTGRVETGPIDARLPERALPELAELAVTEINLPGAPAAPPAPPAPRTPMRPVRLDLAVALPKRVFVRGHGLDSEWEGELTVAGDSAAPVITGRLELVRGRFDFVDRHFKLTEGSISFAGATPPVPVLSVKAETTTGGITAIITLSGPVTEPAIAFSSVPALPSDEVLARVLFGRSVSHLTPYQALRLARIADALARGGDGFALLGRMRRIMKIDRLELTEADGAEGGTAVSAGKYLSDDLYIEVKKGVSDRSTTVSVEKQVSRHLSVESDVGTHRGPGLGIKLRWDY